MALLQIDPSQAPELTPVKLGDSSQVAVGEEVVAIGNPLGLDFSLSSGVVSATNRELQSPNGATITGGIQTDAAINPGNSGGPLFNADGEVIGINEQIDSQSGGNEGIGFAVPINTAVSVMQQMQNGSFAPQTQDQTQTTEDGPATTGRTEPRRRPERPRAGAAMPPRPSAFYRPSAAAVVAVRLLRRPRPEPAPGRPVVPELVGGDGLGVHVERLERLGFEGLQIAAPGHPDREVGLVVRSAVVGHEARDVADRRRVDAGFLRVRHEGCGRPSGRRERRERGDQPALQCEQSRLSPEHQARHADARRVPLRVGDRRGVEGQRREVRAGDDRAHGAQGLFELRRAHVALQHRDVRHVCGVEREALRHRAAAAAR